MRLPQKKTILIVSACTLGIFLHLLLRLAVGISYDKETKEQFRELAKVSKLVFLSNVPENMEKNSYVCCVSVNEIENGVNVGRMMGEYCKGKHVEAGFIIHGAVFMVRVPEMRQQKKLFQNNTKI